MNDVPPAETCRSRSRGPRSSARACPGSRRTRGRSASRRCTCSSRSRSRGSSRRSTASRWLCAVAAVADVGQPDPLGEPVHLAVDPSAVGRVVGQVELHRALTQLARASRTSECTTFMPLRARRGAGRRRALPPSTSTRHIRQEPKASSVSVAHSFGMSMPASGGRAHDRRAFGHADRAAVDRRRRPSAGPGAPACRGRLPRSASSGHLPLVGRRCLICATVSSESSSFRRSPRRSV